MAIKLTPEQWSAYWQNRTITSFHGHFQKNYDGAIKQFWTRVFQNLPDQANILDLATGNGALAILAQQYSLVHDKGFRVTGIDSAEINPTEYLASQMELTDTLAKIRFISYASIENTGLPAGEFQLVMSQFGFEYADMGPACREVARLLEPQHGVFAAMLHHQRSAVLQQAKEAMRQINHCNNSGLLDVAEQLVGLQENLRQNGALNEKELGLAKTLQQSMREGLSRLKHFAGELQDPAHVLLFSGTLMKIFDRRSAGSMSTQGRLDTLQHLRQESDIYKLRMNDLSAAALTDPELQQLQQMLDRYGLEVNKPGLIDYAGNLFAKTIVAARKG